MSGFNPKFTIPLSMTATLIVSGLSPWNFENIHLEMQFKTQLTKKSRRR